MPSGYQVFKNEIFQTVKTTYFTDYVLKEGENILTLVANKCKEEWQALSELQKKIYIEKASTSKKEKKNDNTEVPPPTYEETLNENTQIKKVKKRKAIPKAVKESVWKKFISDTLLEGKCFIGCGNEIQINNFEIGHVIAVANGGKDTIDNLRPICSLCNKSMGKTNLDEFISTFGFKENDDFEKEINTNEGEITKLNKFITKSEKSLFSTKEKQNKLNEELEKFSKTFQELQVKISLKEKEIQKNSSIILEFETNISQKREELEKIQKKMNN